MKKLIKKSLGILLVLFSVLSCFNGCVNGSTFHTHNFKQKTDETRHFKECECGEVTDIAEHTFEWIIDSEPTYTAPGYKHKECTDCGYKTEENTIIERLIHSEGFNNGLTVDFHNKTNFTDKEKFIEFYESQKEKIGYSFLCMDISSEPENGIYKTLVPFQNYYFYYNDETENNYTDPCVVIYYGIYSEEWSPIYSEIVDGGRTTVAFSMYFYAVDNFTEGYRFEFYEKNDPNSVWDYVIQITSGDICVGTVFYSTDVYINREWIVDYLSRNLFVLN